MAALPEGHLHEHGSLGFLLGSQGAGGPPDIPACVRWRGRIAGGLEVEAKKLLGPYPAAWWRRPFR